jgi:hypothetical protein
VAPTQNPLRPDEEFAPACVQFVTNGSRWTEEGCQCMNRMCSECNCSYAEVRSAATRFFSAGGGEEEEEEEDEEEMMRVVQSKNLSGKRSWRTRLSA